MEKYNYDYMSGLMNHHYPREEQQLKEIWKQFFSDYTIEEIRQYFAEILDTCLCSDSINFQEAANRSLVSMFMAHLLAIVEAKYEKGRKETPI